MSTPTLTRALPTGAQRRYPLRHVATVAHAAPGEALITCTCRALRTAVDVDDPQILRFVLAEHLRRDPGEDHVLVDDTRRDLLYVVTDDAEPEILLILAAPGGASS